MSEDPATLRSMLSDEPLLLACGADDLDLALEWAERRYPRMKVMAWSSGNMQPMLAAASRSHQVTSLVGWPSFASMPRPWELAVATRRIIDPSASCPRLDEIFVWGATNVAYRPRSSADRDHVVADVASLAERASGTPRLAQRVGEVAHEMLMNAMYDAPVDELGQPRYAHHRSQSVMLADQDAPTLSLAADGTLLALQVVDPFGRLERRHVLEGIERGRAGADGESPIDVSGGGAGLGLARIHGSSSVIFVDVVPGRVTSMTAFFDMDVSPREARHLPVSLHLFEEESIG